ncbi:hypothetical protein [Polymorphobacter multimanifer]|uniref:hypothetical protein n=1 Tax=Polymorphobacter multimanifer TaxID=1070431 RepID=UPI001663920A|nr:hypothetical protein [Polymorphobacter multimanifer]
MLLAGVPGRMFEVGVWPMMRLAAVQDNPLRAPLCVRTRLFAVAILLVVSTSNAAAKTGDAAPGIVAIAIDDAILPCLFIPQFPFHVAMIGGTASRYFATSGIQGKIAFHDVNLTVFWVRCSEATALPRLSCCLNQAANFLRT